MKPNFAAHVRPFRREKGRPRMVEPPLRSGHLLRTSSSRVSHLKSLLMDNVAYYEHARLTVRHSSGTSFTPGAPLHSACLGSPEFYRRNEGDGWLVQNSTFLRPPSVDLPTRRAGTNENESEPSTLRLRSDYSLPVHRGLFIFIYLYRIFYLGYFYSRGFIYLPGTTAGIACGSFTYFGFLGPS